jgi:hypothetical protein
MQRTYTLTAVAALALAAWIVVGAPGRSAGMEEAGVGTVATPTGIHPDQESELRS